LIEEILCNPRPRMRYTVGMMGQRIVVPLKRFLPDLYSAVDHSMRIVFTNLKCGNSRDSA
jgi:hypothetical protein